MNGKYLNTCQFIKQKGKQLNFLQIYSLFLKSTVEYSVFCT